MVELLEKFKKHPIYGCLLWQSTEGLDGVRYGSYKNIKPSDLIDRKYIVECGDYQPAIYFIDTWYDPRKREHIRKPEWAMVDLPTQEEYNKKLEQMYSVPFDGVL